MRDRLENGVFDANFLTPLESEGSYLKVVPASQFIGYAGRQWISVGIMTNLRAAARSWYAQTKTALVVTEGWRSLETQKELYRRFKAGTGNTAAVPGTSNHGLGIALDLGSGIGYGGDPFAVWSAIAGTTGFSNVEGSRVNELWHWVGHGIAAPAGGDLTPIPTPAVPDTEEDEDMLTIQAVYLDKAGSEGSPIYGSTGVFTSWGGFEVTSAGRNDRGWFNAKLAGASMVGAKRLEDLHVDGAGWEFVNSNKRPGTN